MIDVLTKRCGYDITCLYLLESTKAPLNDKKIYKFGYTKNLQQRMTKLMANFGRYSVIDTLLFLPEPCLSTVEAEIKKVLGDTYRFQEGTETELLALSEDECMAVRATMRSIGKSYYGSTLVHSHQVDMIKNEVKLADKDIQILNKDIEILNKDIQILQMKNNEAQDHRIKELEDVLANKAP